MEPKLVYLQWADATSPLKETWWDEESAIEWAEDDDYWIEQIGWLIKETGKYILIASAKSVTQTGNTMVQYSHLQKIPKTWIRKRKYIEV